MRDRWGSLWDFYFRTMKLDKHIFSSIALALLSVAIVLAQSNGSAGSTSERSAVDVTGEISLVAAGSSHAEPDASRVVVWLVPLNSRSQADFTKQKTRYRLLQRNKRFEPSLLVVPVGSTVDFPNADPWFHNVFSLYRGKRFDLGLYQAGSQRSVKFDRPGPSYLFCNIHPEMTSVVLAVDTPYFAITGKNGRYSITSVPEGKYVLQVWYENAQPESLSNLQRTIDIGATSRVLPPISVPVVKQIETAHKNKYGQDYDPDATKTDY
jgi:plastocyanin